MTWYNEDETKELRKAVEKEILAWPQVNYKNMFGCPCYLAKGKMFAGLVTKGVIITKLNQQEKDKLQKLKAIKPFVAGKKTINSWVHVDLEPHELKAIMPYVKKSYDRAIGSAD